MIDISLYPKHDFIIYNYYGFQRLKCEKCGYELTERYDDDGGSAIKYIRVGGIMYTNDLDEVRKNLLTCDEVIIKNIIE
jgi:hypothetical protein